MVGYIVYLRNVDMIWQVFELWIVIIQVQHSAKDSFFTLSKRAKGECFERLKSMMHSFADSIALLNVPAYLIEQNRISIWL